MNDENIKNCWCEGGMSVNIDMPSRAERFWKKFRAGIKNQIVKLRAEQNNFASRECLLPPANVYNWPGNWSVCVVLRLYRLKWFLASFVL
jgi:hypothetical protein